MGTGFSKKKKQAKMMQQQFEEMQQKLKETEVTGTAGNGLVSVTLNGEHEMLNITIKPECVDPDDIEGLQDLVQAAYKEATGELQKSGMGASGGGMPDLSAFGF